MERTPERVQARLTEEQMRQIETLAARHYDRNLSMATRHVIAKGLQALGLADRRPEVKIA